MLSTLEINAGSFLLSVVQSDVLNFPVLTSCQSPGGITHGKKFGTDYSHNKTVRYECDAEYTLEGKKKLTCNDGKWNYSPPRCKGKKVSFSSLTKLEIRMPKFFFAFMNREGVQVHKTPKSCITQPP